LKEWLEAKMLLEVFEPRAASYRQSGMDALMPIRSPRDDSQLQPGRRIRVVRRRAVLREIEQRSLDPTLSATSVAALLGITPRYVHLLLKETGRTFSRHVLHRRLERALMLLRDPQWGARKIADVAEESGFSDLAYFSRSFRRHFGLTPSAVRQAAVYEDPPA
jgi:AraC-like DNA-binding protein